MSDSFPTLNPELKSFWLTNARNYVLFGGRASSKSWDTAGFILFLMQYCKIRVLCTRQFQNRISDSVYTLLKIQAERFGISNQFTFLESSVRHNITESEAVFYGLARNIEEIKSLESIDIAWHEEAHLMTAAQWKILDITLRKAGSRHFIVFNPRFATDFVYQNFVINPPANTIVRQINYTDNPFLSQTALDVINDAKERDPDFANTYLGVPLTDDNAVIIRRSWIETAIDAHIKLGFTAAGRSVIGFDVADDGEDLCANIYAHGSVALWGDEWKGKEDELLKSCTRTYKEAEARNAHIRYDCIGVGASAGAKFDELNGDKRKRVTYSKFNAGDTVYNPDGYYSIAQQDKVKNKDFFSNFKAQTWWLVADRFRKTYDAVTNGTKYPADQLISIASNMPSLEKLKTELSTPRRDFDQNGRVKVESKKDLEKRNVKSPNLAEAFVMCYAPGDHDALAVWAALGK